MRPEETEYVKRRMAGARETLVEAEILLNCGHLRGTVNRIYYACFYAVSALLFCEGLSSSKHGGVIALFDQHWIKPGRLPVEMGRLYRRFFELRQEGDYQEAATFDAQDVTEWLAQARSFVEAAAHWLQSDRGVEA